MKYNLDDLHWQEFEVLSYKVVQILVASDVQFIEGGSDKGRDFIYEGPSLNFKKDWSGKWIFQAKHKSKNKNFSSSLISDLKRELKKVFIRNELIYDNYVLVTNKTIDGNLFDQLNITFQEFISTNGVQCKNFSVLSYRQIESCIDDNNHLKWNYPNIISHPDFGVLLREAKNYNLETRKRAWLNNIERQREKFVYTDFFKTANDKLNVYPAIILSGPPKSGKTFNAEILALNFSVFKDYQPIHIDNPEEIENAYEYERKQIFVCDDAFGKHSLSYRAEDWFQKLERIFNLADNAHLFIFTSREYIFRAFINFGNEKARKFLEKIIVESHNYSSQEKLSILYRYTQLSNISEYDKSKIISYENEITTHKNFSPETIRAFFANVNIENNGKQLELLINHIKKPDAYLSVVFSKLDQSKKAALLSVLCSLKNDEESIIETFSIICNDLNINLILDSKIEFEELEDSILKVLKTDKIEQISFYHPSMQDFLIDQLISNESGKLREVVIKNPNTQLLEISLFKPIGKSMFKTEKGKIIELTKNDIPNLDIGLSRMLNNPKLSVYNTTFLFKWLKHRSHSLDLRINDIPLFESTKKIAHKILEFISKKEFYHYHKNEPAAEWSQLFSEIKNNSAIYGFDFNKNEFEYIDSLLRQKKEDEKFWMLVFRVIDFTSDKLILKEVGKTWLNNFYLELKNDIYKLGEELFGTDFPEFRKHKAAILRKEHSIKRKFKPNNRWYPRYINVKNRMNILKESKGSEIGFKILNKLSSPYEEINQVSDYAKNRHRFNIKKGWWYE